MTDLRDGVDPVPPDPPTTPYALLSEMFGVIDGAPMLYQGMLRYWLMWRLPQIVGAIRDAPGLKFHLCSTYQALPDTFLRMFLLPDFLTVGQCGHVLEHELLQYLHPFGQHWPRTDGEPPGLGVFSGNPDRPVLDGLVQFVDEWVRPLAPSDQLLFAPFSTMLGPPVPPSAAEHVADLTEEAIRDATPEGRSDEELSRRLRRRLADAAEGEHVSMSEQRPGVPEMSDLSEMELGYGRYFLPGTRLSRPDPFWSPGAILAFEFLIAQRLGSMLVVAGDWGAAVPRPSRTLTLRVPFVEAVRPDAVMAAIEEEAEAYASFRKTMSEALLEAVSKRGSEDFDKEIDRIQRDIIDAGVERLNRTWRSYEKRRKLRLGGYATGIATATVGLFTGFNPAALAVLMGGGLTNFFLEALSREGEQFALEEEPMYFIWTFGRAGRTTRRR